MGMMITLYDARGVELTVYDACGVELTVYVSRSGRWRDVWCRCTENDKTTVFTNINNTVNCSNREN